MTGIFSGTKAMILGVGVGNRNPTPLEIGHLSNAGDLVSDEQLLAVLEYGMLAFPPHPCLLTMFSLFFAQKVTSANVRRLWGYG